MSKKGTRVAKQLRHARMARNQNYAVALGIREPKRFVNDNCAMCGCQLKVNARNRTRIEHGQSQRPDVAPLCVPCQDQYVDNWKQGDRHMWAGYTVRACSTCGHSVTLVLDGPYIVWSCWNCDKPEKGANVETYCPITKTGEYVRPPGVQDVIDQLVSLNDQLDDTQEGTE